MPSVGGVVELKSIGYFRDGAGVSHGYKRREIQSLKFK